MPTKLHEETVLEFISQPGNGGQRIVRFTPVAPSQWVELVPESESGRTFDKSRVTSMTLAGHDVANHTYDPIHESMKLPDGSIRAVREQFWLVGDRQLMSVNAETGPVVYLIPTRERHEQMRVAATFDSKTAPKRPLSDFETAALAKLRAGDDMALQSSSQEMHMLGAIQARNECLSCHKTAEVGTLLGAFTYTLRKQSEETPDEERLKDLAGLTQDERSAVQTVESKGGKVTREPGGPITELDLTHAANADIKAHGPAATAHVRLRDASLNVLEVFPNLRRLNVSHSLITDAGVKEIAKLKLLKAVDLRNTLISTDGLATLKKDLPNCEILHHSTMLAVP